MREPKFKNGDILTDRRGFRRRIWRIDWEKFHSQDRIQYWYDNEQLDNNYEPTGEFNPMSKGYCSEQHLMTLGFNKDES